MMEIVEGYRLDDEIAQLYQTGISYHDIAESIRSKGYEVSDMNIRTRLSTMFKRGELQHRAHGVGAKSTKHRRYHAMIRGICSTLPPGFSNIDLDRIFLDKYPGTPMTRRGLAQLMRIGAQIGYLRVVREATNRGPARYEFVPEVSE